MNPIKHFERGSLVICTYDFTRERKQHGHAYPYKGDLLVVNGTLTHYSGEQLCTFEELKNKIRIPLASKCFSELQTWKEGIDILNYVMKFLTK